MQKGKCPVQPLTESHSSLGKVYMSASRQNRDNPCERVMIKSACFNEIEVMVNYNIVPLPSLCVVAGVYCTIRNSKNECSQHSTGYNER